MNEIFKSVIRNVLFVVILMSFAGFLLLFEAETDVVIVGTTGLAALILLDDYLLRRRRLAIA